MKKLAHCKWNIFSLYLFVEGLLFAFSAGIFFKTRGYALQRAFFLHGVDAFRDFSNHINYAQCAGYSNAMHDCFPPLAKALYLMIGHFSPEHVPYTTYDYVYGNTPFISFTLVFLILWFLVLTSCLLLLTQGYLKRYAATGRALFFFSILFSAVWICGVIERGNIIYLVIILLLAAILLKDSEQAWVREAALLMIALAAGLKIYPAIFGLLYLREKRWKEAIRLVLYGLVCFFLPFLLFGGMPGFLQWLKNISAVQSLHLFNSLSWTGLWKFGALVNTSMAVAIPAGVELATKIFSAIFGAGSVFLLFSQKRSGSDWLDVALCCLICVLVPDWSGYYTAGLFLIPLCMFLAEHGEDTPRSRFLPVCLCFIVIFSCFICIPARSAGFSTITDIARIGVMLLAITTWALRIYELSQKRKADRACRPASKL